VVALVVRIPKSWGGGGALGMPVLFHVGFVPHTPL
jgi:hypothetical protein